MIMTKAMPAKFGTSPSRSKRSDVIEKVSQPMAPACRA
jgi:hypothetical protein